MAIEVNNEQYHDIPLWCVYGPDSFPSILCCKIQRRTEGLVIWGFSIYKRSPGFRTLGITVEEWRKRYDKCKFFDKHEDAIELIMKLTTPKGAK